MCFVNINEYCIEQAVNNDASHDSFYDKAIKNTLNKLNTNQINTVGHLTSVYIDHV